MISPAKFFRQVRQEAAKVTWPTRKETTVSTITVLVLMIIAAFFFFVVDGLISSAVQLLLGLGG